MSRVIDNKFLKKLEATKKRKLLPLLEATLREYAPKECRVMSQENLNRFLNICYSNAQEQGTRNFGEVKAFTFLAFNLGIGFYKDPLYPKIVTIFESTSPIEVKLSRATNYFLKEHYIYTKEQLEQYLKALTKLEKVAFQLIPKELSSKKMAQYMKSFYPQRVEKLGGVENLEKLMPQYHESLQVEQLNNPIGHFVFYMTWMFLGSDFFNDPHYAWVQRAFYRYFVVKPKNKPIWLFQVMMKRLKKRKMEMGRVLTKSESYSQDADILSMLSGCKLNEASNKILSKIEEQRLKELF